VFPTTVGMNRYERVVKNGYLGVPHDRGDEPILMLGCFAASMCSPRPWG